MGGTFSITVCNSNSAELDRAFSYLKELEVKWTRFNADSELSKLNNAEGQMVTVSDETIYLLKAMIRGSKITKGYFDPTTLPLLLKSGYTTSRIDTEQVTQIPQSAKWPGDLTGIQIIGNKVSFPIGTTIDPGGIGKGLAADLVVKMLMKAGATGALVNANGDVVVDGEAPQSGPWVIGIEDPFDPAIELEQVRIVKGAIATSSKVHQTWENSGARVHHLVNPMTGSTAITPVLSASVICGSGADAEALAKVPFILDLDLAINFIEQAGAQVLIVDEELGLHKSSGWDQYK